jgi:hypothetical protein
MQLPAIEEPSSIPIDPDALLDRDQTAKALSGEGFKTSPATLATKATRGGGPPYQLYGRKPLYRWGDALAWARSRLTAPRRSTSEGDVIDQAAPALPAENTSDSMPRPSPAALRVSARGPPSRNAPPRRHRRPKATAQPTTP